VEDWQEYGSMIMTSHIGAAVHCQRVSVVSSDRQTDIHMSDEELLAYGPHTSNV